MSRRELRLPMPAGLDTSDPAVLRTAGSKKRRQGGDDRRGFDYNATRNRNCTKL